jgi:hypothetical protein
MGTIGKIERTTDDRTGGRSRRRIGRTEDNVKVLGRTIVARKGGRNWRRTSRTGDTVGVGGRLMIEQEVRVAGLMIVG